MKTDAVVNPAIYDRQYFLYDNEGCKEFEAGLECGMHKKYRRALDFADIKPGKSVLDIGCGRGEIAYYCAKSGANVYALDYSPAAIEITKETISRLPQNLRPLVRFERCDIADFKTEEKFDVIFMIDIVEHMYDWQLENAFSKINGFLKEGGSLFITTPNALYENMLYPLKTVPFVPFTALKWFFRILRGKYKPDSLGDFFSKAFKIRIGRRKDIDEMHVNVLTPAKLKMLLRQFEVDIKCLDESKNPISLLLGRWMGREIFVVAKRKR